MPTPAGTPTIVRAITKPLFLALAMLATIAMTQLVATPAGAATGKNAIQTKRVSCFRATESQPWGGVSVTLQLDRRRPPRGEPFLVVVDDAEGVELDRFFADAPRYRPTVRIAGDGLSQTPDLFITASVGGEVLGRTRVFRNCGTLDPHPPRAPRIEAAEVVDCDVTVTVRNGGAEADELLVALWLQGSNVAPLRFVELPAGGTGSVTFEDQSPGTYGAEAESVTTFLGTETPFDIVVPEGCGVA
jgi:hypothetical protein